MGRALQRGRLTPEQTAEVSDIRELTRADLQHLMVKRPATTLQSLRDSHHRIARAVASGFDNETISRLCGVSYGRISTLKSDPAFGELVAHYRAIANLEFAEALDPIVEHLRTAQLKAVVQLNDKLDDAEAEGKLLPTRELVSIAELGLDRTGYGKHSTSTNVNLTLASDLEAARKRSASARLIEGTPVALNPTLDRGPVAATNAPVAQRQVLRRL